MSTGTPAANRTSSLGGNLFAQALEKARGSAQPNSDDPLSQPYPESKSLTVTEQAEKAKRQRETLAQHLRVAPVNEHHVFSLKEQKVKQDLERTRKMLYAQMQQEHLQRQELEIPVMGEITSQGTEGKGLKHYFIKLLKEWKLVVKSELRNNESWDFAAKGKREKGPPGNPQIKLKSHHRTRAVHAGADNLDSAVSNSGG